MNAPTTTNYAANTAYIGKVFAARELAAEITKRLEDAPHPDVIGRNWCHVAEMGEVVKRLQYAADFLNGMY